VLDVKFGSGAFMKTVQEAELLAKGLVGIGHLNGVNMTAVLTSMDQPLGRYVGNSVEVQECVDILQGKAKVENGIDFYADTRELTIELSAHMLVLGGREKTLNLAKQKAADLLKNGGAWKKFQEMCRHQGAAAGWELPVAKFEKVLAAPADGYVTQMDSEQIGLAAIELGAGRRKADDKIDHAAGIEVMAKLGHTVRTGQPFFRIFSNTEASLAHAESRLQNCFKIAPQEQRAAPLIAAHVTHEGVVYA